MNLSLDYKNTYLKIFKNAFILLEKLKRHLFDIDFFFKNTVKTAQISKTLKLLLCPGFQICQIL
jgi:hypothetical protein